jgi:hypothetical protein
MSKRKRIRAFISTAAVVIIAAGVVGAVSLLTAPVESIASVEPVIHYTVPASPAAKPEPAI